MAQTTISITLTTPQGVSINDAIDIFCQHHKYQDTINGAPNPQTKAQFAKATIARLVQEAIFGQRKIIAKNVAEQGIVDDITVE